MLIVRKNTILASQLKSTKTRGASLAVALVLGIGFASLARASNVICTLTPGNSITPVSEPCGHAMFVTSDFLNWGQQASAGGYSGPGEAAPSIVAGQTIDNPMAVAPGNSGGNSTLSLSFSQAIFGAGFRVSSLATQDFIDTLKTLDSSDRQAPLIQMAEALGRIKRVLLIVPAPPASAPVPPSPVQ